MSELITNTATTREEWLAGRRTGIGGSDAAAAVGMSKWKTPLQLWLEKRGEAETSESEPMRWGTLLEPVVRQEYANRTGRTVIVPPGQLRHARLTFAIANVDGIADEEILYEGKTARTAEGWGEPGSDEVPPDYMIQTQHCMAVAGLAVAHVAVLIGGSDFRIYEVPADPELQELLLEQEAEFWRRVIENDPPEPTSLDDVRRRWRFSNGLSVPATAEVLAAAAELRGLKQAIALADERAESLAAFIQSNMGEAAELTAGGQVLATWKNVKANPRFDLERFKEEQPDVWKQYLRDPQPQRRFLLKPLKGEGEACPQQLPPAPAKRLTKAPG
jgi:putative phage-type endonuclease